MNANETLFTILYIYDETILFLRIIIIATHVY